MENISPDLSIIKSESYFDGNTFQLIGYRILSFLIIPLKKHHIHELILNMFKDYVHDMVMGHLIESNSLTSVEVKSGTIFESLVTSIDRSTVGSAGSKNAKFYSNNKYISCR